MVTGGGNPKSDAQEPEVGPTSSSGVSSVQQRSLEPLDDDLKARALEHLQSADAITGAIKLLRDSGYLVFKVPEGQWPPPRWWGA